VSNQGTNQSSVIDEGGREQRNRHTLPLQNYVDQSPIQSNQGIRMPIRLSLNINSLATVHSRTRGPRKMIRWPQSTKMLREP